MVSWKPCLVTPRDAQKGDTNGTTGIATTGRLVASDRSVRSDALCYVRILVPSKARSAPSSVLAPYSKLPAHFGMVNPESTDFAKKWTL